MDFVSVRGRMLPRRKSVAHSSHSGTSHLIIGSAATEPFFFFRSGTILVGGCVLRSMATTLMPLSATVWSCTSLGRTEVGEDREKKG